MIRIKLKRLITLSICLCSGLILLGCTKNAPAGEPDPEPSSVPKAESLTAHAGEGRLGLSWLAPTDKEVSQYEVNWYSLKHNGSVSNPIPKADDGGRVHVMLDEMAEGSYLLEIFQLDKDGNSSVKTSANGAVYGPVYQSELTSHTFVRSKVLNQGIAFQWEAAPADLYATEVNYTDDQGRQVLHYIPRDSTRDTLKTNQSTQAFTYRSLYLPDTNAIDTFYTEYQTAQAGPGYAYTLQYDEASKTSYYLTRIYHTDASGNPIKLRLAHTIKEEGETVREFADRTGSRLAFNASTQVKFEDNKTKSDVPSVVAIVEGTIINNAPRNNRYTLGIQDNNELMVFDPGTTAEEILAAGVSNAVTAFVPLILDHEPVSDGILSYVGNLADKNPRQVIAQLDNLDILFLSTGGRGYGGEGMTGKEIIQILKELDVKFAYNLDGGGSTSLVVDGEFINWKIDKSGTQERKRPTFLYVE